MSHEKERRYLVYMKESIQRIADYTPPSRQEFLSDPQAQDAIVWRLQTIADAARNHLSEELRQRHPDIRWRAVYGFRNIAAHGHAGLNLDLVWEIVNEHLEPLMKAIEHELDLQPEASARMAPSCSHVSYRRLTGAPDPGILYLCPPK